MARTRRGAGEPTIIKKYANRRLYDTGRSSYVTLDDLCEMVKEGHDFIVHDAKTGDDITRSVLTQIIVDQESRGGQNLLPIGFLRNLIGFYGDKLQPAIPNYLEQTLEIFVKNQERVREQVNKSFQGINSMQGMFPTVPTPPASLEEINRKNIEMFERTMQMFSPFGATGTNQSVNGENENQSDKIDTLKKNIAEMERELNRLSASE